tara:strand:+ start:2427 stop:3914 length:1488 start_codon:yes stop_codon:yes gene_type:complete
MAKILFIQNFYYDYQSVGVLSACLKAKGHQTELLITSPDKVAQKIKEKEFDLIGFSVITGERGLILKMIKNISHNNKKPVIVGGVDIAFNPDYWATNKNVDFICIGEGENALIELMDCITNNRDYRKIKNLWIKSNGEIFKNPLRPILSKEELNKLPYFDYDILKKYKGLPFIVYSCGRGCLYSCSYCFNKTVREMHNATVKEYTRMRDPEICIEELKMVKQRYCDTGIRGNYIYFVDSTSLFNKKWAIKFFTLFKNEIGLNYSINACVNEITEEIADTLKETGCTNVRIGLESGDQNFRINVLKKYQKNDMFVKNLNYLNKRGIPALLNILFGYPYETLDNALESVKFCTKLNYWSLWSPAVFIAYPETELARKAIKDKLIDPDYNEKLNLAEYNHNKSLVLSNDIDQIKNLSSFLILVIWFPFLFPLVKRLIKIKPNWLFNTIYDITFAITYIRVWSKCKMAKRPILFMATFLLKNLGYRFSSIVKSNKSKKL